MEATGTGAPQASTIAHPRSWSLYLCHAIALIGPFFIEFAWRWVAFALALYVTSVSAGCR